MKNKLEIKIYDKIGRILNTRESALTLIDLITASSHKIIILDFSKVEFMSRSFADQFYIYIEERRQVQDDISIRILNAKNDIIKLLNAVGRTQNKINREYVKLPIFHFTKSNLLSEYLNSI